MNNILWHVFIKSNVSFDEKHISPKNTQSFVFFPPLSSYFIFFLAFLVIPVSVVNSAGLNDRSFDHRMEFLLS